MNNSQQIFADYISRINKVFDYIDKNLDRTLTLDELANAANFSKYHFNRIFHSIVGETPVEFTLRLRLEKAASLIISSKKESISDIAFKCGFSDISVFSRRFKNRFNVSPSYFKRSRNSNISQLKSNIEQIQNDSSPYFRNVLQTINMRTKMHLNKNVEVKTLTKTTVAYIRNLGPYAGDQELFGTLRNKLFAWASARGLLDGEDLRFFVVYHDDPTVTLSDNLRMSLCLPVPEDTKVEGEIGKMEIESGKYAIARFELRGEEFGQAWDWIYGHWMPTSGYRPDDKPYFEMYEQAPDNGNYVIDFCIPVVAV